MGRSQEIWEWVRSLAMAALLAFLIRFMLFGVYVVEGSSMYPTLDDYERLVVNKLVYRFEDPSPGDIIVFKYDSRQDYIKRVVGVGGDIIEISGGQVYRNGLPLDEPYLQPDQRGMQDFGPVEVPPGCFFLMGDHRLISQDSRDPLVGFVSLERIKGRAAFVFWPPGDARLPH